MRADKEREAGDGHDGTWVAHPGLVPVAMEVFDRLMPDRNQLARQRQDVQTRAADLLAVPGGTITEQGRAQQHLGRHPVHRGLAARQRLRADQQT